MLDLMTKYARDIPAILECVDKNYQMRPFFDKSEICWHRNDKSERGTTIRPVRNLSVTIDRIRGDEGYRPGNIRWATAKQQANNKSNNKIYRVNGHSMTLTEIVERYGKVSYDTAHDRITKRGWSVKDAVLTPLKQKPRRK